MAEANNQRPFLNPNEYSQENQFGFSSCQTDSRLHFWQEFWFWKMKGLERGANQYSSFITRNTKH